MDKSIALTQEEQPWTYLDEHLWHTCDILADLVAGTLHKRPLITTRARLARGEYVLAVGPARRLTWRSFGDGSYAHTSVVAVGRPSFVIGSVIGSALGNSSRRRAAAAAAQPRWVMDGDGELTVTDRGVFFDHSRSPASVFWTGDLHNIDLAGPEDFHISFRNTHGYMITMRLHTPWASLLFVLAARESFTAHPRLLSKGWIPADFEERCARAGRPYKDIPLLAP